MWCPWLTIYLNMNDLNEEMKTINSDMWWCAFKWSFFFFVIFVLRQQFCRIFIHTYVKFLIMCVLFGKNKQKKININFTNYIICGTRSNTCVYKFMTVQFYFLFVDFILGGYFCWYIYIIIMSFICGVNGTSFKLLLFYFLKFLFS